MNTLSGYEVSSSAYGTLGLQLDFTPTKEEREVISSSLMAQGYFNITISENRTYDYDGRLTISHYVSAS